MKRNQQNSNRSVAGLRWAALATVVALGASCSSIVENDFDEVLNFTGFYSDSNCSTNLAATVLFVDQVIVDDGGGEEGGEEGGTVACGFGGPCIIALEVINETTGNPLPGDGAQGSEGSPVPSNDGVRIQTKTIRVEYALPQGELPGFELAYNNNIDAGGELCTEFLFIPTNTVVSLRSNPEAFPPLPFNMTARVTVEGVTEGGLDIRAQSDVTVIVTESFLIEQ